MTTIWRKLPVTYPVPDLIAKLNRTMPAVERAIDLAAAASSAAIITTQGSVDRYLDSIDGIDTNPGTKSRPWKTLAKATAEIATWVPGMTLAINRRDASGPYVGQLVMGASGAAPSLSGSYGRAIGLVTYGDGGVATITTRTALAGWTVAGNWTVFSGNIWTMNNGNAFEARRVWLNGSEVFHANVAANVTALLPWFQSGANFYVYATSNPATYFASIESLQNGALQWTLDINAKSYITLDDPGLDIRGGSSVTIRIYAASALPSSFIAVKGARVGRDGRTGIYVLGHSASSTSCNNLTITENEIESGRVHLGYTSEVNGNGVNDGVTLDGCDDSEVSDNEISNWGHSAISAYGLAGTYTTNRNKVLRNYMHSENSEYMRGFGFTGQDNKCRDNEIGFNRILNTTVRDQIFCNHTLVHNNLISKRRNPVFGNGKAQGIELWADSVSVCHDNTIVANTIEDCAEAGIRLRAPIGAFVIVNNVIALNRVVRCGTSSIDGLANICLVIDSDAEVGDNDVKHNLFFVAGVTNIISHRGTLMDVAGLNAKLQTGPVETGTDRVFGNLQLETVL